MPVKLLIVKDDRNPIELPKDWLAHSNELKSDITQVTAQQISLDTLKGEIFDVILVDLALPDSRGLAMIRDLQTYDLMSPILVLTTEFDSEFGVQAMSAGAQDYLVKKEINPDLLTRAIRQAMARQKRQIARMKQAQKWQHCFENSAISMGVYGREGKWREVNQALCNFLGYPREQICQDCWQNLLIYSDDLPSWEREWQQLLAGERDQNVLETRLLRADDSILYTQWSVHCVRFPDQTVDSLIIVIFDMSIHYHQYQSLRESQQRLEMALEGSDLGFWDWNVINRKTYFSPQWKQMLGYEVDEIEDNLEVWERLIHPEDLPTVMEVMNSYLEGRREVYEVEYRMKTKSGHWKWILDLGKVFERDRAGDPVRMAGTHKDIQARKQVETALRESEAKNRALLNVIPDLIFHLSRDGFFLDYQPAQDDLDKVSPRDYLGKHLSEVFSADLAEWNRYYLELTLASQKVQVGEYTLPVNDTWQVYEARYVASGTDSVLAIVRNITKRKQSEAALLELGAKLKYQTKGLEITVSQLKNTQSQLVQTEKMASLGQLVAGIAHEINNPVSFIAGNISPALEYASDLLSLLHLYQNHYPQPPTAIVDHLETIDVEFIRQDLPKLLQSILAGTQRIQKIVLSLRNFSRLDEADKKTVDIHSGIDSTLLILQHRLRLPATLKNAPGRIIEVIRQFRDLPSVLCYPGQLNQVFMNILNNAIDALEERAKTDHNFVPRITIRTQQLNPDQILIGIADNGPGIPPEAQKRLFEPFYTTKPVGKGTGLGLSMSYSIIVEKHQGQLSCQSQMGQGTELMIILPLIQ